MRVNFSYCRPWPKLEGTGNAVHLKQCGYPDDDLHQRMKLMLGKKIHPLSDTFQKAISLSFHTAKAEPSSGLVAIAVAFHVCARVDLFGFRGVKGLRAWYWDKYKGYEGKPPVDKIDKVAPDMSHEKWVVDNWSYADHNKSSQGTGRRTNATQQSDTAYHSDVSHTIHAHHVSVIRKSDTDKQSDASHNVQSYQLGASSRKLLEKKQKKKVQKHSSSSGHADKSAHNVPLEDKCLQEFQSKGMISLYLK